MNIDELNPFLRYCKIHTERVTKKESTIAYDCRLFYIFEGSGSCAIGGQSYSIHPNTAIFILPTIPYRFSFKNPRAVNICVINFDLTADHSHLLTSLGTATESTFDESKAIKQNAPNDFPRVMILDDAIGLRDDMYTCTDLFLKREKYYRQSASAVLKSAIIKMLLAKDGASGDQSLMRDVRNYIREHFSDVNLGNQAIADHFKYHPYHLSRIVKRMSGLALHEYLIDYRLYMARNYLATTSLSVTDISAECGFASYTYFIKLFRERVGMSPLAYRKSKRDASL